MVVMKRLIIILVAAIALPPTAGAVDDKVALGFKGGANVTSIVISGPGEFDPNPATKWALGGFFAYRFFDRLALGAELLYAELGVTTDDFGVEARFDARGFVLPAPFTVELTASDSTHAFLTGGPMWTFFGRTLETFDGVEEDVDEEIADVDFSLFVGGGVRIPLDRGSFSVEARYAHGLVDVDTSGEDTVKTRTFWVLVGYEF